MKKYILIIALLLIVPLVACSNIPDLLPKALASDTQEVVEQVEEDTDDVFAEIQRNIDLVTNLKIKVEQADINGLPLPLDEVIEDIQTVTHSYEKFAGKHDSIRRGLLQKIANIEDMQARVDAEIDTLKQKRQTYVEQLRSIDDPNPDIVRTRQESLEQAIRYVDGQIELWEEFNSIEADIIAEMSNVQEVIDSFLNVIDSSAIVFREGLNLLVLQRDISEALSLFTRDLPRMEQLSSDMEKSWSNLDYLIDTLTSVSATSL